MLALRGLSGKARAGWALSGWSDPVSAASSPAGVVPADRRAKPPVSTIESSDSQAAAAPAFSNRPPDWPTDWAGADRLTASGAAAIKVALRHNSHATRRRCPLTIDQ
jgi:hypothetical protein